jgi:hypothetical protein
MRVALEALDVDVADDDLEAMSREVTERVGSTVFAGARDIRLRLRRAQGALLCVAAVGFAGGDLVTSTAISDTPLEALVGALEGLPDRIESVHRGDHRPSSAPTMTRHAAVREQLKRLLERA